MFQHFNFKSIEVTGPFGLPGIKELRWLYYSEKNTRFFPPHKSVHTVKYGIINIKKSTVNWKNALLCKSYYDGLVRYIMIKGSIKMHWGDSKLCERGIHVHNACPLPFRSFPYNTVAQKIPAIHSLPLTGSPSCPWMPISGSAGYTCTVSPSSWNMMCELNLTEQPYPALVTSILRCNVLICCVVSSCNKKTNKHAKSY